ncbi:hypothetical protein G6M26_23360 [Agrobacterium tumefaciens]|nr:hypothetical protein [Agrobacterium tumefaciens]NTE21482.1 hypothetical protein [Agrobacterium tumefaciens]
MEFNVLYSKNDRQFSSKPDGWLSGILSLKPVKTDIADLIQHLTAGKSICGAVFKNNVRDSEYFISQQIFGVDFDGGLSVDEVNNIVGEFGLMYNFGHYTFNHTNYKPRFRIYFVLDGEVRDARLAKDIGKAFFELFDQKSDQSAIDAARAWLGTDKEYFLGNLYNVTSVNDILKHGNHKIFCRDNFQTRSLLPIDKVKKEECVNMNTPIIYTYTNSHNYTLSNEEENYEFEKVKNWKLTELLEFKLFKVFYEGLGTNTKGNKLVHHELVGLASNLIQLKGGMKLFNECIKINNAYSRDKHGIIKYLNRRPCPPMRFVDFSPFVEDQINPFQSLPDLIRKRGKVTIVDLDAQPTYIDEKEASKDLKKAFDCIMNAETNKVYLLEVTTGLGKTELIKNTEGLIVAFPDNALKQEQFDSSKLSMEKKVMTPTSEGMFSMAINAQIERLFSIGKNEQVMAVIKEIAEGNATLVGTTKVTNTDIKNARSYLEQLSKVSSNESLNKTIFTTHTRAIFSKYQHDTLVFDENPLQHLLEIKKVSIKDLRKFSISEGGIVVIDKLISNAIDDECYNTPDLSSFIKRAENIGISLEIKTNLYKFLESEFYIKEGDYIHYLINHIKRLPTNKKIIIADATAPTELWKRLFGERLELFQIKNVKYKGSVKQFTNRSCSRLGLKTYHEKIASKVGSDLCLTFKDGKQYFKNPCQDMHFGRVRGSNILAGKQFSVVGTPHHNNYFYKFIAKICGLSIKGFKMKQQKVQFKNKEFWFHTFEDDALREIHLELVEGEIIQAVDRARLIRNDVEIHLYSNLPIDQASYMLV